MPEGFVGEARKERAPGEKTSLLDGFISRDRSVTPENSKRGRLEEHKTASPAIPIDALARGLIKRAAEGGGPYRTCTIIPAMSLRRKARGEGWRENKN